MSADAERDAWIDRARAVRIEAEIARRSSIKLKRQGATEWVGPCPVCGEGHDRFSINIRKQVFRCRKCDKGGDVIELVRHLDKVDFDKACETLTSEPPPRKANGAKQSSTKPNGAHKPEAPQSGGKRDQEPAAIFDYVDENDTLLFQVLRYGLHNANGTPAVDENGKPEKTFRQRRPADEPGLWIWTITAGEVLRRGHGCDWWGFKPENWDKLPTSRQRKEIEAVRTVPYRLPEVTNAIGNWQTIFVTEGEGKVDLLAEWNITATCNAGGGKQWTAEHAIHLKGADVVVLPDNDNTGREHARKVAASLAGIATRVRIVELPGLGEKGDIADWIKAGGTREQLDELVGQAPEWKPAAAADAGGDEEEPNQFKAAMRRMSEEYALILVGDKAAILEETGEDYRLLGTTAFKQWFSNKTVNVTSGNKATVLPIAETWLKNEARRSYNGIVFAPNRDVPGAYNLWRGFPVKPIKGDCWKFLAHIRDNVCRGDPELYKWVVAWMADIFQNPSRKIGTSLALRGKMGSGKTIVGKYLRALLGVYYWLVEHNDHVTGRFNAHLSRLLLLHCDEAFWAGDKAGLGRLRSLITSDKMSIEFKGKDLIFVDSYLRLLITGDDKSVVPAGLRERRFAVLDVGENHMQDHAYFGAIEEEMSSGGAEALLYHFLHEVDLSKVELYQIPQTNALIEQKVASMDPLHSWWLDLLRQGELPGDHDGAGITPKELLFDNYVEHAKRTGVGRRAIETQLGMFLRTIAPGMLSTQEAISVRSRDNRDNEITQLYRRAYYFPPLSGCRAEFTRQCGAEDWKDCPDEWQKAEPKRTKP